MKFGDFTLTSGKKSKYYIDVKKASAQPAVLRKIVEGFSDFQVEFDKVAGVELGAVPLIVAFSLQTEKPFVIIRKPGRDHGTRKRIEGDLNKGDRVLVLEDVVTSGGSVMEALDLLDEEGVEIVAVLAVVDREEGGTEKVESRTRFEALVRAGDLIEESGRRS